VREGYSIEHKRKEFKMKAHQFFNLEKIAPLIAATAMLAACGQNTTTPSTNGGRTSASSSTASTSAKIDPCTLVTKEEATALLGVDVTVKSENHDPDLECTYESASGPQTYLKIEAMTRDGARWLNNIKRATEQRQGKIEPVSGIGDQAFIATEPNSSNNLELDVLKGDVLFGLKTLNVADAGEKLKPLARTAAGRLP
jgi:hypothetical protein